MKNGTVALAPSEEHRLVDVIFQLFESWGDSAYFGEPVSQMEHALQVANLAEREGSTDSLIVAGLLHDVGHLVHDLPENLADSGRDGFHQDAGASWLAPHFGLEVVRPIQLHVDAKRFLCAVEPSYLETLSPASLLSLELQGGPMCREEAERFASDPFSRPAIQLRRWDDMAKIPGLTVPPLQHYRARIESVLKSDQEPEANQR
jgi:[1-hydroxy-2-(trimethylamino)ethyl]phosphonate dioxygenase